VLEQKQLSLFGDKPRYKSVSIAEKRSLLEKTGESWPVCDCCGMEKKWNSSTSKKAGGNWRLRCSVRALSHTPGTYCYNANHGIGEPGAKRRASHRRLRDTPGTYRYSKKIKDIDQKMQKYIDGTPENIEYLERVKSTWI